MLDQCICQSCAMPLKEDDFGTNMDGSKNMEYCKYCFTDGHFTTDETMEDMIQTCIPFMKEEFGGEENARKQLERVLPKLKRWSK